MESLNLVLCIFIALEHVLFFILESFLWTKPLGLKIFRMTPRDAEVMQSLAFNQGFYNLFLAIGLIVSVWQRHNIFLLLFLGFVVIAGIVGGLSVNKRIFVIQAMPAVLAFLINIMII